MKFITTFTWRDDILANANEYSLESSKRVLIEVRDGIVIANAEEWNRAFPIDLLLYMETRVVNE